MRCTRAAGCKDVRAGGVQGHKRCDGTRGAKGVMVQGV